MSQSYSPSWDWYVQLPKTDIFGSKTYTDL
jgi:hypothetical protein